MTPGETEVASDVEPGGTASFADSTITYDGRTFPFTPLKQVAQELIVAGGAEALVQKRLASA
ncbi:MAG TPA: hypothetical protein VM243_09005 [Phycisphaerae bacterium]|nr:hypothetical protein [Phycisphaerae bacterium]